MSPPDRTPLLARAWALKERCYAVLNTAPAQAAEAAEALAALAAAHPETPEVAALALWTAGAARITQGRMAEAVDTLADAETAFAALGQPGPAAQTQVPRIIALSLLGRFDEAAACAQRVLQAFKAQGDRQAAAKVSLNLGSMLMSRDACTEALQPYREAAVLFARVGDHEHSVMADIGLADALAATGDMPEALRIYARARMRAAQHGLAVPQALVDESVALLDLARGRYREALAGLEAARRRYEALAMPQHQTVAEKQLADTYLALRLLPEADALFRDVQPRLEAEDMAPELAATLAQRGRLAGLLGDPAEAARLLAAAATAYAAQENPVGAAQVDLARAEACRAAGDAGTALALARAAEQAFAAADRPEARVLARLQQGLAQLELQQVDDAARSFDQALAEAQAQQLLDAQVRALTGQALVALRRGRTEAAEAACEAAIAQFEAQRAALPGDELRAAFLGQHLRPYQERLRIALARHAAEPGPARAAEVLCQLDRVRARTLGERRQAPVATATDAEDEALRARLHWLYRRTQGLDDDEPPSPALLAERQRLEQRLLEGQRRRRLAGEGPGTPADDAATTPAAVQAALRPDQALVAWGVQDDELFAVLLQPAGLRVCRQLASWAEVQEALRAARFQIDSLRHASPALQAHAGQLQTRVERRLQALHQLIFAPLQPALGDARELLLMPPGALAGLPFAALHDGQAPLAAQWRFAQVASLRMALQGLQRPPRPPQRVLALGESSRLPQAGREAEQIAALYPQARVATGAQATLALLQAEAPAADVIHLACHALFRADNPVFSALHLADGALTVEMTERLALQPATVVLGACETGLAGADQAGEGFGLVRAFLVAGAARVLASLWPVDDGVTAGFMAEFHAALHAGQPPAQALGWAQQATMRHHPHPFHWAAFTLHGGG